mmetsp:Transcript_11425/g.17548  ORF Transcript_11425/g.17548 Transcript_11425/m.17548 type:complete len:99 (-) Transcript_11425:71-367(-)
MSAVSKAALRKILRKSTGFESLQAPPLNIKGEVSARLSIEVKLLFPAATPDPYDGFVALRAIRRDCFLPETCVVNDKSQTNVNKMIFIFINLSFEKRR